MMMRAAVLLHVCVPVHVGESPSATPAVIVPHEKALEAVAYWTALVDPVQFVSALDCHVVPLPTMTSSSAAAVRFVPPFATGSVPVMSAVSETLAHVAAPEAFNDRGNWFVQD